MSNNRLDDDGDDGDEDDDNGENHVIVISASTINMTSSRDDT